MQRVEKHIREMGKMAFASDASVNKSGGVEMIDGAKKQVVAGKHGVMELGSLLHLHSYTRRFLLPCLAQAWPFSMHVSF